MPGARLAFVGDGPAREELKAHFAGTPTLFMGMLRGEELSAAYASADIFLMPSETETLGALPLAVAAVKGCALCDAVPVRASHWMPSETETLGARLLRLPFWLGWAVCGAAVAGPDWMPFAP